MSDLSNPMFHDAEKARQWLEGELWPKGPVCAHCGTVGEATLMVGKTTRPGLYQCNACREPFTVTMGTLYERSHIPLNKWLAATHLLMASKKGMSTRQVSRMLGVSVKSAWFMMHRIRESLKGTKLTRLGGSGKVLESDETFVGGKHSNRAHGPKRPKAAVMTLIERGGSARSFHVADVGAKTLRAVIAKHANRKSTLMTDELMAYRTIGEEFAKHGSVKHSLREYVRGDVHTNTAENFFSILKRGIIGTYHHVSEAHLHRYLAEFDYRYNNRAKLGVDDATRMQRSIQGIAGKRLTYRRTNEEAQTA